ncbi:hypothetical protein BHE90_015565, partial [Fusarium euwallaceae]
GDNQYEMQDYNQQPAASSSLSQQEFLNRVQNLRNEMRLPSFFSGGAALARTVDERKE